MWMLACSLPPPPPPPPHTHTYTHDTHMLTHCMHAGGGVLSLVYESIISRFGAVGLHVAVGKVSRGKSNAAKLVISACCNYPKGYMQSMTESLARELLRGALPFAYDDPDNEEILKPLLMSSFGGAEMGTSRDQFSARCSPIATANTEIIERLSTISIEKYENIFTYNTYSSDNLPFFHFRYAWRSYEAFVSETSIVATVVHVQYFSTIS